MICSHCRQDIDANEACIFLPCRHVRHVDCMLNEPRLRCGYCHQTFHFNHPCDQHSKISFNGISLEMMRNPTLCMIFLIAMLERQGKSQLMKMIEKIIPDSTLQVTHFFKEFTDPYFSFVSPSEDLIDLTARMDPEEEEAHCAFEAARYLYTLNTLHQKDLQDDFSSDPIVDELLKELQQ